MPVAPEPPSGLPEPPPEPPVEPEPPLPEPPEPPDPLEPPVEPEPPVLPPLPPEPEPDPPELDPDPEPVLLLPLLLEEELLLELFELLSLFPVFEVPPPVTPPPGTEDVPILPPILAAIPTIPDTLLTVLVPTVTFVPVVIAPPFPAQGLLPGGAVALIWATQASNAPA